MSDPAAASRPVPILEPTRYKTERDQLAMLLNQIMNGDDAPSVDLVADVYLALSLASRLDYSCGVDRKGMAHIWLPFADPVDGHVVFHVGLRAWSDLGSETFPKSRGARNRERIAAFVEAILPPIQAPAHEEASS